MELGGRHVCVPPINGLLILLQQFLLLEFHHGNCKFIYLCVMASSFTFVL